jgi:hypothetical protein
LLLACCRVVAGSDRRIKLRQATSPARRGRTRCAGLLSSTEPVSLNAGGPFGVVLRNWRALAGPMPCLAMTPKPLLARSRRRSPSPSPSPSPMSYERSGRAVWWWRGWMKRWSSNCSTLLLQAAWTARQRAAQDSKSCIPGSNGWVGGAEQISSLHARRRT